VAPFFTLRALREEAAALTRSWRTTALGGKLPFES
jgi:hypothetical protein